MKVYESINYIYYYLIVKVIILNKLINNKINIRRYENPASIADSQSNLMLKTVGRIHD